MNQLMDTGHKEAQIPSSLGKFSAKKKIAPRSGLQFRVGPEFSQTDQLAPIFTSSQTNISPILSCRLDRGFDLENDQWIGYKRNYFTLVSAFHFAELSFEDFLNQKFGTIGSKGEATEIKSFAINLHAYCIEDGKIAQLVQHTAKRDKEAQIVPQILPAVPGRLPEHDFIKDFSNIRNKEKIEKLHQALYFDKLSCKTNNSIIDSYPENRILRVAKYERLQFATSISGRGLSTCRKHFKIRVELLGYFDSGKTIQLARSETPPLIVRGRSPSKFQPRRQSLAPVKEHIKTEAKMQASRGNEAIDPVFQTLLTDQDAAKTVNTVNKTVKPVKPVNKTMTTKAMLISRAPQFTKSKSISKKIKEKCSIIDDIGSLERSIQNADCSIYAELDELVQKCNKFVEVYKKSSSSQATTCVQTEPFKPSALLNQLVTDVSQASIKTNLHWRTNTAEDECDNDQLLPDLLGNTISGEKEHEDGKRQITVTSTKA